MQRIGSRVGSFRLVSAAGLLFLAFTYLGSTGALAAAVTAPAITSAIDAYFHVGTATTFTVTTTGNPTPTITESGAIPAGLSFTPNPDGTATLSGTAQSGQEGDHIIAITATNGVAPDAVQSFTIEVGAATPTLTSDSFSAIEGQSFTGQVAHFINGNPPFTATIDWGDTSSSVGTITGTTISGTHTYAEEGVKSVTVHLNDSFPSTTSSTRAETVGDAGLISGVDGSQAIAANEGASTTFSVGSFSDGDAGGLASDYIVAIAWGDGTTSAGTMTAGLGGSFNVTGTHEYAEHGVFNGTVTITDNLAFTTNSIVATIAEVNPLVVTGKNITATAGVSFTAQVATFTDPGAKEATSEYNVRILWGDGTATDLTGTVGDPPGVLTVSGTHTYAAVGTYTITIGAEEVDANPLIFAIGTGSATVTALPLTSAPQRPLPIGFLVIAVAGLLLAGGSVVAWRRRTSKILSEG